MLFAVLSVAACREFDQYASRPETVGWASLGGGSGVGSTDSEGGAGFGGEGGTARPPTAGRGGVNGHAGTSGRDGASGQGSVNGVLWQRTLDTQGEFGPWQPFSQDPQPVRFTALSSGGDRRYPNGGLVRLIALGDDGIVYGRMRRNGTWEGWTSWPDDDHKPPPAN